MSALPIADNIGDILYITGAITAAVVAQFLAPKVFLRAICKIEMREEAGLLFARHWGLMAFVIGGLLMYAGSHAAVQFPVVLAALVEKAGFSMLVLRDFRRPYVRGLRAPAIFDVGCVVVYGVFLLGWA